MTAPLELVTLTISRIYSMIYLIDITNIDKIYDYVCQKFKFLCKLIGCEVQDEAEQTIIFAKIPVKGLPVYKGF